MRPSQPSFGQLPAQQQRPGMPPPAMSSGPKVSLFVGSISAGITDEFLNQLLAACGPVRSFKRLITPAGKPQGFGFAEFDDLGAAQRALTLLNGIELPALEDGAENRKILIKADERVQNVLNSHMVTDVEDTKTVEASKALTDLLRQVQDQHAATNANNDADRYVIPPHLHDLQEGDLPEQQRGLVISEIAQFRERAAKKEKDKQREVLQQARSVTTHRPPPSGPGYNERKQSLNTPTTPQGPNPGWAMRHQQQQQQPQQQASQTPPSRPASSQPAGFVRETDSKAPEKSDEQMEQDRREQRAKEELESFRDRERRWETRERRRIADIERQMGRERMVKEAEERDCEDMRERLRVWDDDESDEVFYTERGRWRVQRGRTLNSEREADDKSRAIEEQEAEELRKASEAFLAQQMEEMQALVEEQRKAGMLLDDTAPIKLSVAAPAAAASAPAPSAVGTAFAADDDDDGIVKKRKMPLINLDFSALDSGEKMRERLDKMRESLPKQKDQLFKARVRWDGVNDSIIDKKIEPLTRKLMDKHLGDVDEELLMFVIEHLKDQKGPVKLVEGLSPVLAEEAEEFVISLWRQVIFESLAYGEGMHTGDLFADND
ncbi:hypothetical protein BKA62DRAFT_290852 [Auriculariales sp. MPI-PUGE-AT-0066]|nr:hypothetical protein BKA62DRAFT_290852 [Auriculariales sp. MPI-PUGE-AT-0066]